MTNNSTRRTLLTSVLSLFLCFSMLIGTTFAWFTDSATSGGNVITAGSLKIDVQYTLDGATWNGLKDADDLFQKGLWEPGHTEVVAFKITNAGDLALKYIANLNVLGETVGKTADGNDIVLSEILTVSTLALGADQADKIAAAFASEDGVDYDATALLKDAGTLRGETEMLAGDVHYLIVKVDMADTVGNEGNSDGVNVPSINLDVSVLAAQLSYENDSFGNGYDEDAKWPAPALPAVGISAEECTWEQITMICEAGKAEEYFDLGDTKTITLSDGTQVEMEIIAFDADEKTDGSKAAITWLSKSIVAKRTMKGPEGDAADASNAGGWGESDLRAWLQSDFYNTLSADVRDAIVTVRKSYAVNKDDRGQYNNMDPIAEDNVWIPSLREICPVDKAKEKSGADYYDYFTTTAHKELVQRPPVNESLAGTTTWWLRTSELATAYGKYSIANQFYPYVQFGLSAANAAHGVVFGFCT